MLVFRVGIMMTETTFWQETATWLLSEQALWLYSWIGLALAMALLAGSVLYMTHIARKKRSSDFLRQWRGAKPKKPEAIQKRIHEIERFTQRVSLYVIGLTLGIVVAGAILPGGLLALVALWQDWFLPGPPVLLIDGAPFIPAEASLLELALFITHQALSGGLADTFEVYRLTFTQLESNPDNFTYSGLVVLYRLIAGTAMATLLYAIGVLLLGLRHASKTIKMLEEQKAEAILKFENKKSGQQQVAQMPLSATLNLA